MYYIISSHFNTDFLLNLTRFSYRLWWVYFTFSAAKVQFFLHIRKKKCAFLMKSAFFGVGCTGYSGGVRKGIATGCGR